MPVNNQSLIDLLQSYLSNNMMGQNNQGKLFDHGVSQKQKLSPSIGNFSATPASYLLGSTQRASMNSSSFLNESTAQNPSQKHINAKLIDMIN